MVLSMTGFGRSLHKEGDISFKVEIKTVNHRYLDLSLKTPRQLGFLEEKIRALLQRTLSRGKVDVFIQYENFSENSKIASLDTPLADAYVKALDELKDRYSLSGEINLTILTRFPDIIKIDSEEEDEDLLWGVLEIALKKGLDDLVLMRSAEGQKLKDDLIIKCGIISQSLEEIEKRSSFVVEDYKKRLETRLIELLDNKGIDETRMAMEVAVFADRAGIDEEIVRQKSHVRQFLDTLDLEEPVGRKLDFLVQEMIREINTIGSKANDIAITKEVLLIKAEIEKMREQIQNIE